MRVPEGSLDPSSHLPKWEIDKLEALPGVGYPLSRFCWFTTAQYKIQKPGNKMLVSFIYAHRNHVYPAKSLRDVDESSHLRIEFGGWENNK